MYSQRVRQIRQAFTLIELLIVILIISLVYFLGFEGVELGKPKPKPMTPLNLKDSIRNTKLFQGHATLLCTNQCTKCYLRKNLNSNYQPYSSAIDLTGTVAYTLDRSDHLDKIEYGRFNDEKICLVMDFYDNGSSTKIVLNQKDKSYLLPAYFGKTKVFDSLDDAEEAWLHDTQLVSDNGEYY